jgi:shikimate kinase
MPAHKKNVVLVGPMGTGKSTIGRLLAKELQFEFKDSDREIEERSGADIPWIFDVEGEAGFRAREKLIIRDLSNQSGVVLATGGGAVMDPENQLNMISNGFVVFLNTTVDQQYERTRKDRRRPLLQNQDPRAVLEELMAIREPIYRAIANYIISTDYKKPRAVVRDVIKAIGGSLDCASDFAP